jgi:hypothetical protein
MDPTTLKHAEEIYNVYGSAVDFKNYQGLPMPKWEDLTPKIQGAWTAVAAHYDEKAARRNEVLSWTLLQLGVVLTGLATRLDEPR